MRHVDRVERFVLVSFALVLSACANVHCFHVDSQTLCAGDEVRLRWAARGLVRLEASPEHPVAGAKRSNGEERVALDRTTLFTLAARSPFRRDFREIEVVVAPPAEGYGEAATCDAEQRQISTHFTLRDTVSAGPRIELLRNELDRPLVVDKDGHSVRLAAGEESPSLRGAPVTGAWTLTSPLAPEETCDEALESIGEYLQITVDMGCGS